MPPKQPGFGMADQPWSAGGLSLLLLLAGITQYRASGSWGSVVLLGLGVCCMVVALYLYRCASAEAHALRLAPPTAHAELTHIVMRWLGAIPQDLAANQHGLISADQMERIKRSLPAKFTLRSIGLGTVVGPVKFRTRRHGPNVVVVAGITFSPPSVKSGFLECFKRTATYRVYYAEVTYTHITAWPSVTYTMVIAAEALSDA